MITLRDCRRKAEEHLTEGTLTRIEMSSREAEVVLGEMLRGGAGYYELRRAGEYAQLKYDGKVNPELIGKVLKRVAYLASKIGGC